jgi:acyl-CoA synthetase (AMP-forming)/AMP-acid ligase II
VNLAMLLEMVADGLGDRVAIGNRADGLTYARVRELAAAVPKHLAAAGATTVALADHTGPIVPVALFGAAWAGASYAPLNYRLPEAALTRLVEQVQPAMLVDPPTATRWLDPSADAATDAFPDEPERPAILLFTSGTSAAPKAAVLRHEHLLSYIFNTVEFAAADEDEAVLLAVPPFHVAGVAAVLSSTYAGRRIVPLPAFSAEAWLEAARREEVTHAFVVPTMLARIVSVMDAEPDARVPSLRHLAYGGARMPLPVLERALELFPDTGFVNAYGLTETSSTVAVLGPDDHRTAWASDDPFLRKRLESAGRAVPGIEVRIADADGAELGPDEPGQILVRGAQVSGGYVGVASQRDDEGWLHTGDVGYLDGDGYLFIGGRADDVIIRGGENIAPAEIEDVLLRHPAVASAAAVGVPDLEWGERVAAMITLRPGADIPVEEIVMWAREELGSLKAPQTIAVRDELPHTATGKVIRREVREELVEGDR